MSDDGGLPFPDEYLPDLTFSLRLDYAGDFNQGFAVVDVFDPDGHRVNRVRIDLISQQITSENEACDDLQQMEQKAVYLVWCYNLQQLFTERDPQRESLVDQWVKEFAGFPKNAGF